ncbi:uncharacterized protein PGRI_084210 [Penicillium griseofulvum]|uniref:Uncharacterized protein n=1 Tax=Penicillium patulum TaxID=5078 RepID=A0A135LT27_PENPA|nr:uncharacterized protein PGRI_084210 [Penicillium griseofulvum]KXG52137.1 hypothetical protein PGRI_084210 [Penicillium griseofulvum]
MSNQENKRGNPPKPQSKTSTSNPSETPAPSLASRIQTSATGLAKSAFTPSSDIANTLASTTNGKAGPSSLPNTQTSRDLSATTHGTGTPSASTSTSTAQFREHDTSNGLALPPLAEDEFQNGNSYGYDGIETTTATNTTTTYQPEHPHEDLQTPSSTWKGKARAHDPTQHQLETVWQRQWQDTQTKEHEHTQTTDGAAVVSLLSDATFDPNFEDPTTVPDTEIDIAAMPHPLSASEKEALDSFRKGMGVEEEREGRLTGRSLVPDIDVFLSQGLGSWEGNTVTGSTSLRDEVLTNLPGAGDWVGVQERYHDEVWGFLQPVLEEARVEIEGREEGGGGEDGPAVRRLKMILMHMKG